MINQPIYFSREKFQLKEKSILDHFKNTSGEFKAINRLACLICSTPISLVNMLDEQFQYTVSRFGEWHENKRPVDKTVCQFAIEDDDILIINDTLKDERTNDITDLIENRSIRFYAGVPLKSSNNQRMGSLCVYDFEPRELTNDQIQALKDLTKEVEYRISLFEQKQRLEYKNEMLSQASAFLQNSTDVLWIVDPASFEILKSSGAKPIFGKEDTELEGVSLMECIDQVNLQKHLKNWLDKTFDDDKFIIPIQVDLNSKSDKWLNLSFSRYDKYLLVTGRDITKEHLAEINLKESLEEKEILLSEIHHRVKNNLAIVSSLLSLERIRSDNDVVHRILMNSESRILAITKIHELLYQTKNFSNVDLKEYLNRLTDYLSETYGTKENNIKISQNISGMEMNVNQALPMGLILNELITNSLKYAFNGKDSGNINIQIHKKSDKILCKVSDNGNGIDMSVSEFKENGNLGFTLIDTLCKQIDAEYEMNSKNGTTFGFTFKTDNRKGTTSSL